LRKTTQGRVKTHAEISTDDRKYRLRQFYAILLKADKARLLVLRESTKSDKGKSNAKG